MHLHYDSQSSNNKNVEENGHLFLTSYSFEMYFVNKKNLAARSFATMQHMMHTASYKTKFDSCVLLSFLGTNKSKWIDVIAFLSSILSVPISTCSAQAVRDTFHVTIFDKSHVVSPVAMAEIFFVASLV